MSLRAVLQALATRFAAEEEHLNRLDAATGDGDHGTTMSRGMSAATVAASDLPAAATERELLQAAGSALLSAAGGASGALFGSLLLEFAAHDDWATRFERGAQRVARVGKASPGDKSMLDALIPAGEAFKHGGFAAAASAASEGAEATIPMSAKRGRARYIENGGAGQIDPGAVSIALMVEVLREHCA